MSDGIVSSCRNRLIRWLEDNRGLVIVVFCLPASFLFDCFMQFRIWLNRTFFAKATSHEEKVKEIQNRATNNRYNRFDLFNMWVKDWNRLPANERKLLCTARPNWLSLSTTFFDKSSCHQIPIDLHNVISLDEKALTVTVEPNVSVHEICKYLVPKGYTLAVTLEFGDATFGGLALGVGMTTYSHKVGLYQEAVEAYELVTSSGDVITVTAENEHRDLFYCLPWSHGTLGFLVGLKLRIIKVKPYIKLQYIPCFSQQQYCEEMMKVSGALNKDHVVADYVEATIFSKDKAVIMLGTFADVDDTRKWWKINDVCRWWKPWFYKHVEAQWPAGGEEYIPLESYLLRHNRAIFWVLESMIPFGNHPLFRALLGWLCPPKPAFLKFTTTRAVREMTFAKQVFQDIVMPLDTLADQVNTSEELFDTYPLLVYPCRIYDHNRGPQGQLRAPPKERLVPGTNYAMFNDLGVYGTPGPVKRREAYNPTTAMRAMEKFTRDVGGYSFLYADIFMNEGEFNEMFDMKLYNEVRSSYKCDGAFPRLYEKVKPEIDVISIGEQYGKEKHE